MSTTLTTNHQLVTMDVLAEHIQTNPGETWFVGRATGPHKQPYACFRTADEWLAGFEGGIGVAFDSMLEFNELIGSLSKQIPNLQYRRETSPLSYEHVFSDRRTTIEVAP